MAAQLRAHGRRTTLEFDRVPPVEVMTALKSTGWRWDPRLRVWWSSEEAALIPAGVVIPASAALLPQAKAPTIRRRAHRIP